MKLHFALASPFVRKVRVVAAELGLEDKIELVSQAVTPVSPVDGLNAANPLGKIPALELGNGRVLFDSRVITEYLNDLGRNKLTPRGTDRALDAKTREALGDGICDALVLVRYETFLRPENARWTDWVRNQMNKAMRGMDHLETTAGKWTSELSIGSISAACALGYADFRYAELNWRSTRPKLASWYDSFAERPSMQSTKPE